MTKKKYFITTLLVGSMLVSVGCNNTVKENSQIEQNTQSNIEEANTLYGKVHSIDGTNVTLKLGTFNMKGGAPQGERPEGAPQGERPQGTPQNNGEPPQIPEGQERPEMPQGGDSSNNPNGEKPPMENKDIITLNGEEKTIAIDETVTISKQSFDKNNNSNETISLSDLKVDDILKVKYKDDGVTIESIELVSMPGKPNSTEDNKINESTENV